MFATRTLELALHPSPSREIMVALDAGAQAALNSCTAAAQKVFHPELWWIALIQWKEYCSIKILNLLENDEETVSETLIFFF